jgi:hypothetical protein
MSELNIIEFKERGIRLDWFSKFRVLCCSCDMAFKTAVLDFLLRPVS